MAVATHEAPPAAPPARRSEPVVAVAVAAALVAGVAAVGVLLTRNGVDLHLGSTHPVAGHYRLHLDGWLLPALALGAAAVHAGPRLAAALPWRWLLLGSWAAAASWAVALGLVGGGPAAVSEPLTGQPEYLFEVDRIDAMGIPAYLSDFDSHIVDTTTPWTTHVAGHPPLVTLLFVGMARLGLGGAGWAAALCICAGAAAAPAVLDTVRRLAGAALARRAAPFVAVAPTALWVATSADALFAGVAAAGIWALVAAGGQDGRWRRAGLAAAGGLALGAALFLSYGLVLLAPLAIAGVWAAGGRTRRGAVVLGVAAAAVAVVVVAFAASGFWWLDGLARTAQRVAEGAGHRDRPGAYFLVANLAALAVAVGPATVGALPPAWRARRGRWLVVPAAALLAVGIAVASQLSRGEVERIYLPFAVWLLPLAALLPAGRRWLAAAVGWALLLAATTTLAW